MVKVLTYILRATIFIVLTILTQIGGLIYLICLFATRKTKSLRNVKRLMLFMGLYAIATFLLVPMIAPLFGRERIAENDRVKIHSWAYVIANRNYVDPKLNEVLTSISEKVQQPMPGLEIVLLDSNFPFLDGYPLLPHLSHDDGEKLDLTFVYQDSEGDVSNLKRSRSGYGIYEHPKAGEFDQASVCRDVGAWQYDFPKYLHFGEINKDLDFALRANGTLVSLLAEEPMIGKIFIEPHLKTRMNLNHPKIRFHGCGAVRHDDHIHVQLK